MKKEINRIFLLGDSWIEGQGCYSEIQDGIAQEPNLPFGHHIYDGINHWRKNNSWNKFFKDTFGSDIEINNLGLQGSNNYQQFSFLQYILARDYRDTDLILFGFTSKYRDNGAINPAFTSPSHDDWFHYVKNQKRPSLNPELLNRINPINNTQLSFEKIQIQLEILSANNNENIFLGKEEFFEDTKISESEKEFSKKWIQDFFIELFDERTYENIAQINYMFYQKYCKWKGINILFFDLFEPYIDKNFINEFYNVDSEMYINYNKKTFRDMLVDYEMENFTTADNITVWESNNTFPCLNISEQIKGNKADRYSGPIYHPNQHGYKYLYDYLLENYINPKYNIIPKQL
jgi:hypothetical protein